MGEQQYGLSQRQVQRIQRALNVTERQKKGAVQGKSDYRPNTGLIQQGVLTQSVHYDPAVDPQQWKGQMQIWCEPDPSDKTSILAAVDSEVDEIDVWPSLIFPTKTYLDIGEQVIVAWISGRWRVIGARDCPTPEPDDSEY